MLFLYGIILIAFVISTAGDIKTLKKFVIKPIFILRKEENSITYINDGNGPAIHVEIYQEENDKREIFIQQNSVLTKEFIDLSALEKGSYKIRYEDARRQLYREEILIE